MIATLADDNAVLSSDGDPGVMWMKSWILTIVRQVEQTPNMSLIPGEKKTVPQ